MSGPEEEEPAAPGLSEPSPYLNGGGQAGATAEPAGACIGSASANRAKAAEAVVGSTGAEAVARAEPAGNDQPAQAPGPEARPAAPEAPAATTQGEPDLAHLLAGASEVARGGVALEARCPHQPETQLMLDQQGRLHLLQRHRPGQSHATELAGLREAVTELLEAKQWVQQHHQLLQLTQRQCRFDPGQPPILHLFTSRADLATGLIARLGQTLKLHLLQHVRVGQETGWYCTSLN
jgi:hypothetical protein